MQNTDLQDNKQKYQNDFLKKCIRKILIYAVSVLLVAGIVLGIVSIRNWQLQKEAERIEEKYMSRIAFVFPGQGAQ